MGHDQAARAHAYRQWLNAGIAPARPRPHPGVEISPGTFHCRYVTDITSSDIQTAILTNRDARHSPARPSTSGLRVKPQANANARPPLPLAKHDIMKNHSIFMVCGALGMLMSASSLQAQETGSITFSGAVTTPTCSADQARHGPAQAAHRYACPSNNIDAAEGTTGPHYRATVQIVAQLAESSPLLAYFADYTSGSGNPAAQLVTQTFE